MVLGNKEEYAHLLNTSMVHVDDVARAHIFLLEYPEAKGRYNCSSHTVTIQQMSEFLSTKYPEYPIPAADDLKEIKGYKVPELSSKKLLDTGFRFINRVTNCSSAYQSKNSLNQFARSIIQYLPHKDII
ncbi:hypothetical protein Q3G72_006797 [Acer saccharum]|nr:hypothetical protein Q3G72_006797 [Acer saccharum]